MFSERRKYFIAFVNFLRNFIASDVTLFSFDNGWQEVAGFKLRL